MELVSTSSGIHTFKHSAHPAQNSMISTTNKTSGEGTEGKVVQVNGDVSPKIIDTERKNTGTLLDIYV